KKKRLAPRVWSSEGALRGLEDPLRQRLVLDETGEDDRPDDPRRGDQRLVARGAVLLGLGVDPPLHVAEEAAPDLREAGPHGPFLRRGLAAERRHDAAALGMERVVRGEIRPQGLDARLVAREHAVAGRLDDGLGDEVLAVLEVAVETAVREPG